MFGIEAGLLAILVVALLFACLFEFINGFHDTANAVATVIYTNSLKPNHAVIWSGLMNFLGVVTGGVGVGISIIYLLPVELLIDQNIYHSIAMVMAMLISAIIWNFGTWYLGLPSSSSHTLIGAILGVGLGYALLPENTIGLAAVNWEKAQSVFTGLLLAPLLGFSMAIALMFLLKNSINKKLQRIVFSEPKKGTVPPTWIRLILIGTCTLVSFFHGKNDGQKGIGLVMLILIGILPTIYGITSIKDFRKLEPEVTSIDAIVSKIDTIGLGSSEESQINSIKSNILVLQNAFKDENANKLEIRGAILSISSNSKKLLQSENINLSSRDKKELGLLATKEEKGIRKATDYAPLWVILLISISLGLGTMIGWKRIVVTVGEKIGKTHLTYAQGASAELVAAITIGLATGFGMPVSTTHTLSSGIAGSMVANKGIKNLQSGTVKSIALAWVLTLPVSIFLSASLFLLFRWLIG
ncbi:inorganic phosphate transporter [Arcticibacterium luteifluviistationis]|uniref:Phosphate transporter n=1 Tax=Arcticibacterium luteifluviistationis TaxID=1784714 RepID=A0A2Z4GFZ1_9BACT|nr:inorganic phosphate transporter [Arcticibacterium luteifluviistationis]AWW00310.1 anion permease [Arcticibacterium luteifluviistationis]